MKRFFTLLFVLSLCASFAIAQAPTDNAYRSYVSQRGLTMPLPHWTDSLRWDRVLDIRQFQNLVRDTTLNNGLETRQNWWYAYNAASTQLKNQGGGVLFFPALPAKVEEGFEGEDSSYWFHENLPLKTGVIVRGSTPPTANSNAKERSFYLPTYFEFPKYNYGLGIGVAGGTPNNTAFKMVVTETRTTNNTGLVNIDINRAGISIHPDYEQRTVTGNDGQPATTSVAVKGIRNLLVLSCRNNNAALPAANVPSGNIATWHRFCWTLSANYDLYADANVIVANNRINDLEVNDRRTRVITSDNFQMNNYCAANVPGGGCLSGNQAIFNYTEKYGIFINRLKKPTLTSTAGFLANNNPEQEPDMFITGVICNDNWIFKTSRVAIQVAGIGTEVKRNILLDDSNKVAYLSPTGTNWNTNAIATYENRGIDFSGWGHRIEDNYIEAHRTILKSINDNARSADGEGWYAQGSSSAIPRNHIVRGNTTRISLVGLQNAVTSAIRKGINGIQNVFEITNVLVENNDNGCIPMQFNANTQGGPGKLSNLVVRNNTFVRGVEAFGTAGGEQNYIINNTGCNTTLPLGQIVPNVITMNCHISLNPNVATPLNNSNTNLPLQGNCVPTNGTSACLTPYPVARIFRPTADTTIFNNVQDTYRIYGVFNYNVNGGCNPQEVAVYRGTTRIGIAEQDFNDSLFYYDLPISTTFRCDDYNFVARFNDGTATVNIFSPYRQICMNTQIAASLAEDVEAKPIVETYPNPASDILNVKLSNLGAGKISVTDLTGRVLLSATFAENNSLLGLPVQQLGSGAYLIRVEGNKGSLTRKFLKQ